MVLRNRLHFHSQTVTCKQKKMKQYLLIIITTLITNGLWAQYLGPIPALTSGYGSEGLNAISVSNITNDHFLLKDISVFYPTGTTTPIPTIYFLHGFGANDTTNYIETLRIIASNGYAIVFVPYKTIGATISERYLTLYDGFIKASQNLPTIIDTTRVGFFGHSFGGGATPRIAYRLFTENNWGTNGKFIYCSAPWYSYELGTTNLSNFPTDCNMLTVLFDKDDVNDHRMGMDVFNNIAIDDSIKDCIIVYADTVSGYAYEANHSLPTQNSLFGVYDAHDYYVTFRLLSALADYTFTGNLTAKDIALGNGSTAQIDMGSQLSPLYSTNSPSPIYSQSIYQYPCDSIINERQVFCQTILGIETLEDNVIEIYPNPTNGKLKINPKNIYQEIDISILTLTGQNILRTINQTEIDISHLPIGTYFVLINIDGKIKVEKILKIE